ncbi:MAG: xylose isomerase [Lentisphaerales bacterium]|jgi:hydroxypyruvate isomerase|nr:MAG: xylose isomerase [Lentisphaerales bacterium]
MLKPAEMGLDAFFEIVAEIGFDAVELWGRGDDFAQLMKTAAAHRLAVASFIGVAPMGGGLNAREHHARIQTELQVAIDVAADNGIPGIICFSGDRRPGLTDEEGINNTAEGLKRIAPYAEQKGVNLNLELLNSRVDHKGHQCDHTAWAVAVCEQVNSPRVKILYDIYHMQIMEGDLIRTIRDNIAHFGHFHTAGVPGRGNLDDMQEINYSGVARAISETGYDLYVGHEFTPGGDLVAALRQAYNLFNVV